MCSVSVPKLRACHVKFVLVGRNFPSGSCGDTYLPGGGQVQDERATKNRDQNWGVFVKTRHHKAETVASWQLARRKLAHTAVLA